jgi:hypothetical protein
MPHQRRCCSLHIHVARVWLHHGWGMVLALLCFSVFFMTFSNFLCVQDPSWWCCRFGH